MKVIISILLIVPLLGSFMRSTYADYMRLNSYDTTIVGIRAPNDFDTSFVPPDPSDTTVVPSGGGARQNLIFELTYETPVTDPRIGGITYPSGGSCCAWSHTYNNSISEYGSYSSDVLLNKSDPQPSGSSRSEYNFKSNGEPDLNFERRFATGTYFPIGYQPDRAGDIFIQFHHYSSTGYPPLALWTLQGRFRVALDGTVTSDDLGAVVTGTWIDWEFHIIWDTDGTHGGVIEIWKNDVLVFQRFGKNSPPGLPYGPYVKWGEYKWPWKTGSTYVSDATFRNVLFDETRYGNERSTRYDVHTGAY